MNPRCTICKEKITDDKEHWTWEDEDAHGSCVLDKSDTYCKTCEEYFGVPLGVEDCPSCLEEGKKGSIKPLTNELREKFKKKLGLVAKEKIKKFEVFFSDYAQTHGFILNFNEATDSMKHLKIPISDIRKHTSFRWAESGSSFDDYFLVFNEQKDAGYNMGMLRKILSLCELMDREIINIYFRVDNPLFFETTNGEFLAISPKWFEGHSNWGKGPE